MRVLALPFAAAVAAAACSGARLEGGVYRDAGVAFRVGAVPAGWTRIAVTDAKLAFRDDEAEASILVNARCGTDADDVPLASLTQHLFLLFTERDVSEQTIESLDGREAMHTVMTAKLDGVPKAFDVFVLKKDGCVYDFVQISAPASFDRTRPEFERFVSGFRTLAKD